MNCKDFEGLVYKEYDRVLLFFENLNNLFYAL